MGRKCPLRIVGDVSVVFVVAVYLTTGLAAVGAVTMAPQSSPGSTEIKPDIYGPPQPGTGDFDWIQLKNGEWLKGENKDLQGESFSFESDELDMLRLDWEDTTPLGALLYILSSFTNDANSQPIPRWHGVYSVTQDRINIHINFVG